MSTPFSTTASPIATNSAPLIPLAAYAFKEAGGYISGVFII